MMPEFHILVPARLASTRLPDKPLADLGGRALVLRVLDRARQSAASSVHVATDSARIAELVQADGGSVLMTRADHPSGTERLAEAVAQIGLDDDAIVVNLQGDEPLMPVACVHQVVELLAAWPQADMATLWWPIEDEAEWRNPNAVKLVADAKGRALYFSRSPIPWPRNRGYRSGDGCRHLGLYAYRVAALRAWPGLPDSPLEDLEALEQLKALTAGWTILCARANERVPAGIDTPEDLERVCRQHFS